jgi:hypothetical protein
MVVARVCLDMLRSRTSRREEPVGAHLPEGVVSQGFGIDPEHEALLADSVGPALLVVLQIHDLARDVVEIAMLADPERLRQLDVAVVDR